MELTRFLRRTGSPLRRKTLRIETKPLEEAMAKGQMRSNKEKKKPKQDKNKKSKGGAAPSPFAAGQGPGQPGAGSYGGKKG
jgi:hypothetical protein